MYARHAGSGSAVAWNKKPNGQVVSQNQSGKNVSSINGKTANGRSKSGNETMGRGDKGE